MGSECEGWLGGEGEVGFRLGMGGEGMDEVGMDGLGMDGGGGDDGLGGDGWVGGECVGRVILGGGGCLCLALLNFTLSVVLGVKVVSGLCGKYILSTRCLNI